VRLVPDRTEAGPELGDEDQDVHREPDVAAGDAERAAPRQVGGREALQGPGAAEADVACVDGAPGEDGGEAGERDQPLEHVDLGGGAGCGGEGEGAEG